MEIQRIKIENIASIEKADIDFTQPPLSVDPIFLITGDTGTGKTTILNAICLALYNKVPAFTALGKADDQEGVPINSTNQMMRKGAGSASVELHFIGNDDKRYIIFWRLRRARGKATGNFQTLERELQLIEGGVVKTSTNKTKEIEAEVERLVGVKFEQFMRTTMLAQGQFALFMKGDDNAKAEILEKLTETDIYTRIGQEVNARYKSAKDAVDVLQKVIDEANLLDDDKIAEYTGKITEQEALKAALSASIATIGAQIKWLEGVNKLANEMRAAEEAKARAAEVVASEAVTAARDIVEQWDATIEIRRDIKRLSQDEQAVKQLRQDIDTLGTRQWTAILNGVCALEHQLDTLRIKHKECGAEIERQGVFSEVYENAQRIAEKAKNAKIAVTEHDKYQQEAERQHKAIVKATADEGPLAQAREKALADYDAQKAVVDDRRAELDKHDIQQLTDRFSVASNKVTRLRGAVAAVGELMQAQTRHAEDLTARDNALKLFDDTQRQLDDNKRLLPAAQERYTMCESFVRGLMQMQDVIVSLRERFAHTGECPLCGNTHATMRTDEKVDAQVAEAQSKAEEAKGALDTLQAKINADRAALAAQKREIEKCQKTLEKSALALDKARAAANAAAPGYEGADALQLLEQQLGKAEDSKVRSEEALKVATDLRKQFDKENDLLAKHKQALDDADKRLERQKITIKELNDALGRTTDNAARAQQSALDIVDEVRALSKCDTPEEDAMFAQLLKQGTGYDSVTLESLQPVCDFIVEGGAKFDQLKEAWKQYDRDITETQGHITRCQEAMRSLTERFGAPHDVAPIAMPDIDQAIIVLNGKVAAIDGQIKSKSQEISELTSAIDAYFAESPLTRERVAQLDTIAEPVINKHRRAVADADRALADATVQVDVFAKQLRQLNDERPEMPEDANIDTLNTEFARVNQANEDAIAAKKHYETLLEQNEQAVKRQATNVKELAVKKVELEQWSSLNDVFGRNSGAYFRKVAQSYILQLVLIQANRYLHMLMPRYTLLCGDGSLSIDVADQQSGGSVRNVGSLSGGEGFVVSLALALGLSAISKNDMRIGTLFIDEGFGSLDHECLDIVLGVLTGLHNIDGRRIGIISHVQELKDTITTQIQLERTSPSTSSVSVISK